MSRHSKLRSGASLSIALCAILLAGCPSTPVQLPEQRPWTERRSDLQARDSFELHGRVAVAAGSEGFNARLRWQQAAAHTSLALDGPLGVGGVRVSADGTALSVTTSKGERLDSERARAELAARLGFEPPLESLRYWVLGVPDPSSPATESLDDLNRLAALEQDGWRIEYSEYRPAAREWLPQRLTLSRDDVRVRLVIDGWD